MVCFFNKDLEAGCVQSQSIETETHESFLLTFTPYTRANAATYASLPPSVSTVSFRQESLPASILQGLWLGGRERAQGKAGFLRVCQKKSGNLPCSGGFLDSESQNMVIPRGRLSAKNFCAEGQTPEHCWGARLSTPAHLVPSTPSASQRR